MAPGFPPSSVHRMFRWWFGIPIVVNAGYVSHAAWMIDLNTATAQDLDTIPELKGHGFEIVRYREERGRFETLRQLDEVPGLTGKWDGAETSIEVA